MVYDPNGSKTLSKKEGLQRQVKDLPRVRAASHQPRLIKSVIGVQTISGKAY
jgi:hypothetical protein